MERNWLEQKYIKEKLSMATIAKMAGCSAPTVQNYLNRFNIPTRSVSEALTGKRLSSHVKDILLAAGNIARQEKSLKGVSEGEKARLAKIRHDRTGIPHSEATKEKMRQRALGRKNSEATKKKMSETRKNNPEKYSGKNHPLFGKKRPDVTGNRNPNWNGGVSSIYRKMRQSAKYKEWRQACFERDRFACQTCGKTNTVVNVDHIKPFALIIAEHKIKTIEQFYACGEMWNMNNGRTLCVSCHEQTPTFGSKTRLLLKEVNAQKEKLNGHL